MIELDNDEFCAEADKLENEVTQARVSDKSVFTIQDMSYEDISDVSMSFETLSVSVENIADVSFAMEENYDILVVEEEEEKIEKDQKICITVKNDTENVDSERVVRFKENKPIFASDLCLEIVDPTVQCVRVEGSVQDVIQIVKSWSLNRDIWLSVGNNTVYSLDTTNIEQSQTEMVQQAVNGVISDLESFNEEVKSVGGRLFITTLIPCPKLINQEDPYEVESNALISKELASKLFLKLNKEIIVFNHKNGYETFKFNRYLEAKNKKKKNADARGVKGKAALRRGKVFSVGDQRKINEKLYLDDMIHLKQSTVEKITTYLVKAINNPKRIEKM